MFKKYFKYMKYKSYLKKEKTPMPEENEDITGQNGITKRIELNLTNIEKAFRKSDDLNIREFKFGIKKQIKAFVCFIDGLGDKMLIDEFIVKPLMVNIHLLDPDEKLLNQNAFNAIKEYALTAVEVEETTSFNIVLSKVLSGETALFIDGYDTVLIISAKGGKTRGVEEPNTETVVRGPRDGFTETLRVNTSLLRRKIKNTNLVFEPFTLGKQTNTEINIAYIDGIADKKIVDEVKNRLSRIDTDAILESGYIEQFIEDNPLSTFSTVGNSERPDKVAAKLLEGRVAILCDNTPFVLTVPHLFIETLQTSEDYYFRPLLVSFLRLVRFFAFLITLMLPSLYVALETYHQEMIPTVLLITMAAAREGIPFPSLIETLIMLIIFQLIRESGVRLPKQVGQAVSIVGALVIGEAAVMAGIISAPMVIIGSLTGITSFIVPALLEPIIFFRYLFVFLGAAFGLYGIAIGTIIMVAHMSSLKSFGAPYLSPIAPTIWKDLKDSFIRVPLWLMKSRPKSIVPRDSKRQSSLLKKPGKYGGGKK